MKTNCPIRLAIVHRLGAQISLARDLEQTIARNVVEILEA